MQYPKAFVRTLNDLLRHTTLMSILSLCICLSLLTATGIHKERFSKLLLALTGIASSVTGAVAYRDFKKLQSIEELLDEVDYKKLGQYYNDVSSELPEGKQPSYLSEKEANRTGIEPEVTDIFEYWKKADNHLLLIGGTGDGKSTFISSFAQHFQGLGYVVSAYDTHATIDDYTYLSSGSVVTDMTDIEEAMIQDLQQMKDRLKDRKEIGWRKWTTTPLITIGEEFSSLVREIETLPTWINKLAKEARKAKMFMCLAVQNDTVANLGLKGDIKVRDTCFTRVYLGKAAVNRAAFIPGLSKEDKKELIHWLSDPTFKYKRCLVDDKPALTPEPIS